MGKQQKLTKLANAVTGILGDEVKGKRLKKGKALKRFIKKMEARRKEIVAELEKGGLKKDREKLLKNHLETLDKQLKKAQKILSEM